MNSNYMEDDIQQLQLRLEAIEREYNQLKQLVDDASNGHDLDSYGQKAILYVDKANKQIVDANVKAVMLLGYSLDQLMQLTINQIEITPPADAITIYIRNDSEELIYACDYLHQDGYHVAMKVHCRELSPHQDNPHLLHYTLEDQSLHRQLWHELQRREDSHFQFREKLKSLNEINAQLTGMPSLYELCRQAVIDGRDKLGFDRIGIWLWDEENERMNGTYGIDENGIIRDERHVSWSYDKTYVMDFVNGKNDHFVLDDHAPIFNHLSEIIGYGWHIAVPLMRGQTVIGVMSADNFINRLPLKDYQPELLRLYGLTLGHLAVHQREQDTIRNLSNAIQHSNSMIAILNSQQIVEFVNPAYERISGYPRTQLIGKHLSALLPEQDYRDIERIITQGKAWQGELVQEKRDGTTYEVLCSIASADTGDKQANYVLIQENITALKRVREQEFNLKIESERRGMLEAFINDIGHEFRTPLSVIHVKSYLLKHVNDPEKREELINVIHEQVATIGNMIDNILYIVRLDHDMQIDPLPIDLTFMIKDTVDSLRRSIDEGTHNWDIQLDTVPLLKGNTSKLRRAFHEIIKNASQHAPVNSTIQVILEADTQQIFFSVHNQGKGIPQEIQDKIFTRLYRADPARTIRGTGLGLSIARHIIEAHGGSIHVQSETHHGTKFTISLPYPDN